jgi:asparagine synthase (glutamine-hydrolysing)
MEVLTPELKAALYSDPLRDLSREWDSRAIVRRAIAASDGESQSERCAHADVTTYLADDILVKVDVASMAHGLECRAPLLDHVLAEFVAGLPFRLKISGWESKAVLKGAVRRRLPRAILSRRKKGFNVPLKSWFRSDLDPFLRETLLSQRAVQRGYFNRAGVESLIDEHTQGEVDRQGPLLSLVMHELWHQLWIDGAGA